MVWHSGLEKMLRRDVPLSGWTTFRIGGPAAYFLTPPDEKAFAAACASASRAGLPVRILGGGSNLLVSDEGVKGAVLSTARLRNRVPSVNGGRVRVLSGTTLQTLLTWSARNGMEGLEGLAGIPGTVGGAVTLNAGAGGVSIGERVEKIWCVKKCGGIFERKGSEVRWAYRSTDIEEPIVAVEFLLRRGRPNRILGRLADALDRRKASQPVRARSAGCFFRNPPNEAAGRLIDRAGLKGLRAGKARVSTKHANFIVNSGGASAGDVLALSGMIRKCVRERFGVNLDPEVCRWS